MYKYYVRRKYLLVNNYKLIEDHREGKQHRQACIMDHREIQRNEVTKWEDWNACALVLQMSFSDTAHIGTS